MSIIDTLRKFCDGTPLSPEEVDELGKRGFIKSRIGGDGYELTVTGRAALAEPSQLAYDQERNRPPSDFELIKAFNLRLVMNQQDLDYLAERKLITRGGDRWFITTAGKLLLDSKELPPGDSASCPDEDSYLPPKSSIGAGSQHAAAQNELNQQRHSALDAADMVNHPPHYKQGDIECIDAIKAALTDEEYRGYCKGNALKYIWRERHKGGAESLAKAGWYLDRMVKA